MDVSRRTLLRSAGATVAAGSLLGGVTRSVRAHAEVADEYRAAHGSNYRSARRTADDVQWLVVHTIEGTIEGAIGWFQNPDSNVSSHFVVGDEPDQIVQMVHCDDVAWTNGHAGYNATGISIELEGYADETEFNDHVYEQAAAVARWACEQYDIPVRHPTFDLGPCDGRTGRGGIVGHDQIPSPNDCSRVTGGKYDPGNTWDWDRFLRLVRGETCPGSVETFHEHGTLSGAGDGAVHDHALRTRDTCRATVSLSGPADADFDLFVTLDGRPPSRSDYDRASRDATGDERVVLEADELDATLGLYVDAYSGGGEYALTVTEAGAPRFEDGQWVRTTAEGWAYRRPWAGAARLDRLSVYSHGRVVNGPTRNDGRVWWGVNFVNDGLWAWVPGDRLAAAPGGPRFRLGDRVQTTTYATVYRRPREDSAVVDRKPPFTGGEVVNGATRRDDHVWWGIRFDDYTWAWCPQVALSG